MFIAGLEDTIYESLTETYAITAKAVENIYNIIFTDKIDDDTYVCTCYFEQAFCGYRDGKPVYKDITRKKVKCYVVRQVILDEQEGEQHEYMVMLGDVTALETRRVN